MQVPFVPLPEFLVAWQPMLVEMNRLLAVLLTTGFAFLGVVLLEEWSRGKRSIAASLIMFALAILSLAFGLYLVVALMVALIGYVGFLIWVCIQVAHLGLEHR